MIVALRRVRLFLLMVAAVCAALWGLWGLARSQRHWVVLGIAAQSPHHLELPDEGALPDFALRDEQGGAFTRASLAGNVWVADFIFTRCAGQCPMMSGEMARLQRRWDHAPGVSFVSFSVDPSHDTPDVLAAYAQRYGANTNRWRFVTGESHTVEHLIREGFHLAFGPAASRQEPITHSVRFVLIDQRGHLRGSYEATDARTMRRLDHDLQRLIRAGP